MREALLNLEESLALIKSSIDVFGKSVFISFLQKEHQKFLDVYEAVDLEDDFEVDQYLTSFY